MIRQLHALGRGLLALGVPAEHVAILLRQVALDSMPEPRRAVLGTLALGEALSTAALGRAAGLHRHVARMAAEELEVVGVVRGAREGADDPRDEVDRRAVTWELDGDDGDLVAEVFAANARDVGWHEIYVPHLPHPPNREETGGPYVDFVPPSRAGQRPHGAVAEPPEDLPEPPPDDDPGEPDWVLRLVGA